MFIEIDESTFKKVKKIIKLRNTTLYNEIKDIKSIPTLNTTLEQARIAKTDRVKNQIEKVLLELINANITPSKYKIHKHTNIAYVTLNKYYDEILAKVL